MCSAFRKDTDDRIAPTVEEHHGEGDVRRRPPWRRERRANERDLGPVERDDSETEAGHGPEQLVDDDVVRCDPADPVERGKRGEEVTRDPVPAERADQSVREEALSGETSTRSYARILLGVQGVEQGASDQVGRPDHGRRVDQEPPCDASDRETDLHGKIQIHQRRDWNVTHELSRHDQKPLVRKVLGLMVEHALNGNDIRL